MSLLYDWSLLRARIRGLEAVAAVVSPATLRNSNGAGIPYLVKMGTAIDRDLQRFDDCYKSQMLPTCGDLIASHLKRTPAEGTDAAQKFVEATAPFFALATEMDYLLADNQLAIQHRAERAFEHLRRLIQCSTSVRQEWQVAFSGSGETACEALGSTHLLMHGIFAFKAHATSARTDLILNDVVDMDLVDRVADGLVLTEWKKVTTTNAESMAAVARAQAKQYSETAIARLELRSHKYIVLVSEKQIPAIQDEVLGHSTFRHINIAVDPDTPSVAARKM